jgi:hypothetical protein
VQRSRKRGSIHPLPHTSSWRSAYLVKRRDSFTLYTDSVREIGRTKTRWLLSDAAGLESQSGMKRCDSKSQISRTSFRPVVRRGAESGRGGCPEDGSPATFVEPLVKWVLTYQRVICLSSKVAVTWLCTLAANPVLGFAFDRSLRLGFWFCLLNVRPWVPF